MNTPTLDKMLEIQEQSELCGEFLDWFLHKFTVFDRKQKRESPYENVMGAGDYINKERLLADFLILIWMKLKEKKESLLKAL